MAAEGTDPTSDDGATRASGAPPTWLAEVTTMILASYEALEDDHLQNGLWQLNIVDGAPPSDAIQGLSGRSEELDRDITVWSMRATNEQAFAEHLHEPVPFGASAAVLLRRAWVGFDRFRFPLALTVIGADPQDIDAGPQHKTRFQLLPAVVAYAVPADEQQAPALVVQLLTTVAEAQAAGVLPKVLGPELEALVAPGPHSARHITRVLPAARVRHHPTEGFGPVPALRYALTGSAGIEDEDVPAGPELPITAISLLTLADAAENLPHASPQVREQRWQAAIESVQELASYTTWTSIREDQAGLRRLGDWVPAPMAEHCHDEALFALKMLMAVPAPPAGAERLLAASTNEQIEQVVAAFSAFPHLLRWFPVQRTRTNVRSRWRRPPVE